MGSYYYGENVTPSNSSHSSSSRKGKKNGPDKPKQPQRGLGVAQLESLRLRNQLEDFAKKKMQDDIRVQTVYPMQSSSSFSYSSNSAPYGLQGPHGVMMGFQDIEMPIRCDESQSTNVPRWHFANVGVGSQQYVQPDMTRSFFEPKVQDFLSNKKDRHDSMRSSSPNSESTNTKEIDLELRLSLYK